MDVLQFALPASILVLAFVLKLFVDRTAGTPEAIRAFLELPVDIAFLAASLMAAFILTKRSEAANGLVDFVIYVVGAVIVVVLWRRSSSCFDDDKHFWMSCLSLVAYGMSFYALVHSVALLSGARP